VSSDRRLKTRVEPLGGALARLLRLRGVTFEWREPARHGGRGGPQVGFIAQEVETVFPDWVDVDDRGYRRVTVHGFEALTVEALRELADQNQALRQRVTELEKRHTAEAPPRGSRAIPLAGAAGVLVGAALLIGRRRRERVAAPHVVT
jgi:hypothetical protein